MKEVTIVDPRANRRRIVGKYEGPNLGVNDCEIYKLSQIWVENGIKLPPWIPEATRMMRWGVYSTGLG